MSKQSEGAKTPKYPGIQEATDGTGALVHSETYASEAGNPFRDGSDSFLDGGLDGKGPWEPTKTGFTPGHENDFMNRYISGDMVDITE